MGTFPQPVGRWRLRHFHPQAVAEQIPLLVQGVRGSQAQPDSPSAQLALIAASQSFLQARPPADHSDHTLPTLLRACIDLVSLSLPVVSLAVPNPSAQHILTLTHPVPMPRGHMVCFTCPPVPQQPGGKMVAAAKASVPTIQDQASAMQLSQCAKNLGTALAELRTAAQKVWELAVFLEDEGCVLG